MGSRNSHDTPPAVRLKWRVCGWSRKGSPVGERSDMIAVISDIHANREALEAVLEELGKLKPAKIICLGDIVGYGPDPVWCVDTVKKECNVVLGGNHDYALIYGAKDFSESAGTTVRYHRQMLMPRMDRTAEDQRRAERWDFLKGLPHRYQEDSLLYVHASPRNPVSEYLQERDCRMNLQKKLTTNFSLVPWLCFHGHTHQPGVITEDFKYIKPKHFYKAEEGRKAIINVGSVGQPRDSDPRACFVTLDGTEVQYVRVEYDIEAAIKKIQSLGGLDPSFPARLRAGI